MYKQADGRWVGAVVLADGKRRRFYGKRKADVEDRLNRALERQRGGLPVVSASGTVATFLNEWLAAVKPSIRANTFERYEQYVRLHAIPVLGKLALANLQPQHVQQLYSSRLEAGASPTTVAHLHAVLHRAFGQAAKWSLIPRNVAEVVDRPRIARREMATLNAPQVRKLLATAKGDDLEALYTLAVTTGMRQGEVLALRWRDVDLDGARLQVVASLQRTREGSRFTEPKTSHSRRRIALAPKVVTALRTHRTRQTTNRLAAKRWEDNDLVFPNDVGRPILPGNLLRRSFWPLLEKAGLPRIRFHDLRHTAATLLLAAGTHPKVAQEMLGHSTVGMTLDLYSHAAPDMQETAVRAMEAVLAG
ncbi:MAG: tyrosine-type recombinase/integrase [Chloroflexota bacterium]